MKRYPFDVASLLRAPLFAALSPGARSDLAAAAHVVLLGRGEQLWRQGAPADSVALILAGRCKVLRAQGGREVIVDVAIPGDVVGTVGFTLGRGYSSTIVCLRRAHVAVFPGSLLRALLKKESGAVAALAADLASEVTRLMKMIESLSAGSVQRRLASAFLALCERAGEPFPGGILIPLRLRRSSPPAAPSAAGKGLACSRRSRLDT
jgi:CRP-like cAMP-binding protein